jgi:tRNA threonylcarbamoyladenosine biosynthesis protein TsaE
MISSKIDITTHSVAETQALGQQIGTLIQQPLIIALIGDLGSGKTAFVQGLAQGLEVPADYYITSPTFTLINEYPARLPLFHIDLYRLETAGDLEDIGLDELLYDQAVLAVEWADKLADKLFGEYLSLRLEIIADDFRKITLIAYGQNGVDLIKALEAQLNLEGAGRLILDPSN